MEKKVEFKKYCLLKNGDIGKIKTIASTTKNSHRDSCSKKFALIDVNGTDVISPIDEIVLFVKFSSSILKSRLENIINSMNHNTFKYSCEVVINKDCGQIVAEYNCQRHILLEIPKAILRSESAQLKNYLNRIEYLATLKKREIDTLKSLDKKKSDLEDAEIELRKIIDPKLIELMNKTAELKVKKCKCEIESLKTESEQIKVNILQLDTEIGKVDTSEFKPAIIEKDEDEDFEKLKLEQDLVRKELELKNNGQRILKLNSNLEYTQSLKGRIIEKIDEIKKKLEDLELTKK